MLFGSPSRGSRPPGRRDRRPLVAFGGLGPFVWAILEVEKQMLFYSKRIGQSPIATLSLLDKVALWTASAVNTRTKTNYRLFF